MITWSKWLAARIVLLLAFAGAYWLMSMALDREPPIRYVGVRALEDSVAQGGTLNVRFEVFRRRICQAKVSRWLTDSDGKRHSIPSYTVGRELMAGSAIYSRSITIPTAAATGKAYYQVTLDYACNPFQKLWRIEVVSPRVRFDITPGVTVVPGRFVGGDG